MEAGPVHRAADVLGEARGPAVGPRLGGGVEGDEGAGPVGAEGDLPGVAHHERVGGGRLGSAEHDLARGLVERAALGEDDDVVPVHLGAVGRARRVGDGLGDDAQLLADAVVVAVRGGGAGGVGVERVAGAGGLEVVRVGVEGDGRLGADGDGGEVGLVEPGERVEPGEGAGVAGGADHRAGGGRAEVAAAGELDAAVVDAQHESAGEVLAARAAHADRGRVAARRGQPQEALPAGLRRGVERDLHGLGGHERAERVVDPVLELGGEGVDVDDRDVRDVPRAEVHRDVGGPVHRDLEAAGAGGVAESDESVEGGLHAREVGAERPPRLRVPGEAAGAEIESGVERQVDERRALRDVRGRVPG